MDLGLKNKVALVAGASKGLGRAVARELAAEGAHLAICSRNQDQIRQAAERVYSHTGSAVYSEHVDLTRAEEVRTFVSNAARHFGDIHILITNSGGPPAGLFVSLRPQDWVQAFNLNLMSVVHLCSE